MNWKFWQKKPVPPIEPLVIGGFYIQKDNPWPDFKMEITDLKNGWVRYQMHYLGRVCRSSSVTEETFRICYERGDL